MEMECDEVVAAMEDLMTHDSSNRYSEEQIHDNLMSRQRARDNIKAGKINKA